MSIKPASRKSRGFSLIELVVAIVILSIGVTAFLVLINQTVGRSADPMVISQANAIAQSYLEEVVLANFCDPDLSNDCSADCAAGCNVCTSFSNQVGETRATFDDVCDYNNLPDNVVRNRFGNQIASLSDYSVMVQVNDTNVTLGSPPDELISNNGQVVRINVNVSHANGTSVSLTGYKTNY
jgi:MSHA pilin protein MshD